MVNEDDLVAGEITVANRDKAGFIFYLDLISIRFHYLDWQGIIFFSGLFSTLPNRSFRSRKNHFFY